MTDHEEILICTLNNAESVWTVLSERVDALIKAWADSDKPPNLADFVPTQPASLRSLGLVELIKIDLERRWKDQRAPKRIEQYIEDFPELAADGSIPPGLVYEEYHIRSRFDDSVAKHEYLERFRDQAEEIRRLFEQNDPRQTTAVFSTDQPETLDIGDDVDDFDLLTRLGKGAFATVFLARQKSLQRLVALKVSADRGKEPQTLAQLDHPNIVRVYDQRVLADRSLRLLYMQYVTGGTLEDVISTIRNLPVAEQDGGALLRSVDRALDSRGESPPVESATRTRLARATWPETVCIVGLQLAGALHYAHQRGVLHRDLKPANILVTAEGSPKLVDFNVSSCSKVDGAGPAAFFGGSLPYMSPEQLEAAMPVHERTPDSLESTSDVYSLGVLLWELLTGSRPFHDERLEAGWEATLAALLRRRQSGVTPASKAHLPADCPESLKEVLLKCLEPNPADRYQSAGEVKSALRLCLKPAAQNLLRGSGHGWKSLVRRYSTFAIVLAALLPNAVAGVFNFFYNHMHIVERLGDETAKQIFERIVIGVNVVAFPLGIAILIALYLPVARALKATRSGEPPAAEVLRSARQRCLKIGHYVAVVGIAEWLIAAVVYPVVMQLAGAPMEAGDWGHFIGSLAACGLIAAAYPFFAIAIIAVRCLYPGLFRAETATADDLEALGGLNRSTWFYLVIAAMVPMLAIVMLIGLGQSPNRPVLVAVGAAALVGLLGAFLAARLLQRDCRTLAELITSSDDSLSLDSTMFSESTFQFR